MTEDIPQGPEWKQKYDGSWFAYVLCWALYANKKGWWIYRLAGDQDWIICGGRAPSEDASAGRTAAEDKIVQLLRAWLAVMPVHIRSS